MKSKEKDNSKEKDSAPSFDIFGGIKDLFGGKQKDQPKIEEIPKKKRDYGIIGNIPLIGGLTRQVEDGKEYNPLGQTPFVGEILFGKPTKNDIIRNIKNDVSITSDLGTCDITRGLLGHPCGKLNYRDENFILKILGYILLAWVIFVDLILDIFFVIWDLGSNLILAVPVIGPLLAFLESLEIDDWLDAVSGVIVFTFCGPVEMFVALLFELPEGPLEIIPMWTIVIGIWFFVVRPAKERIQDYQEHGILDELGGADMDRIEELFGK